MLFHDKNIKETRYVHHPISKGDGAENHCSSNAVVLPWSEHGKHATPITVRLANSDNQRNSARMLVERMYSNRGYGGNHPIPQTPTHTTFTATSGENTIGTITLAVDSSSGLAADKIFREEIDIYRRVPGAKVCELTKLAFDSKAPSKPLLASMFHLVFIYGQRRHHCTELFIEVNPRHTVFYETMLGFKRVGTPKINASVDAPAQLLVLEIAKIREEIDKIAHSQSRSLYRYFFSHTEEDGIYARMSD